MGKTNYIYIEPNKNCTEYSMCLLNWHIFHQFDEGYSGEQDSGFDINLLSHTRLVICLHSPSYDLCFLSEH